LLVSFSAFVDAALSTLVLLFLLGLLTYFHAPCSPSCIYGCDELTLLAALAARSRALFCIYPATILSFAFVLYKTKRLEGRFGFIQC
jgi:hypothetical protein